MCFMQGIDTAVKAIIMRDNRVLILKAEDNGILWTDLPGGRMEYGESPTEALKREVREETTLDIEVGDILGAWWFFRSLDGSQVICITYLCDSVGEVDITCNPADEDVCSYEWVDIDDLDSLKNLPHESIKEIFRKIKDMH